MNVKPQASRGDASACPQCGSRVAADSLRELCLACLLRLGFDAPEPGDDAGAAPPPATAGRRIGDYELIAELGRGGNGVVWRARHRALNRIVALKIMRFGSLAGEADLKRFQLEAEATAALNHPHIVPIYEVGEHDGQPYLVLGYIEGGSLAERALDRARPFPHREGAALLATVARAVHHAHQRGILHRDLKPSNILLDRDGQPHLTDFGLARRLTDDACRASRPPLTQTGAVLGTPEYMAPEQAAGGRGPLTIAADVHALGAILYHLLTGQPPFQAATPLEILVRIVKEKPKPPSAWNQSVPRDLEIITLKCLEKSPGQRYASALALAEDLERFLRGEPIRARPAGLWRRTAWWSRQHPARAFGLAAALVVLTAFSLMSVLRIFHTKAVEREEWLRRERFLAELGRPYASLNSYRDRSVVRQEMGLNTLTLTSDIVYSGPNKLRIRSKLNFSLAVIESEIYCDGRTFILHLPGFKQYFEKPIHGPLQSFLRERAEEDPFNVILNATLPLYAVLLEAQPQAALRGRAKVSSTREGDLVDGASTYEMRWTESHHLNLHDPDRPPKSLDATTSVRASARQADGVLVKSVVDLSDLYRALGDNQYVRAFMESGTNVTASTVHSGIELNPAVPDEVFVFHPPPGTRKVDRIEWPDWSQMLRKTFPDFLR